MRVFSTTVCIAIATLVAAPAASQVTGQTQKIGLPGTIDPGDFFGQGVGISEDGTVLAIGAWTDNTDGFQAGSAYILTFDSNGQILTERAAPGTVDNFDNFGYSAAATETIAVFGAPGTGQTQFTGAVYVFEAQTGTLLYGIQGSDQNLSRFGTSVAISGNTLVVGAPNDNEIAPKAGAVFVYDATTGAFIRKLTAPGGESNDLFGFSVGISGNIAIVGSYQAGVGGRAYFFDVSTGQVTSLLAGATGAGYGYAVAISGNTAIVGAINDQSAELIDVSSNSRIATLTGDSPGEGFGTAVSISGDTAVVGAYLADLNGDNAGVAYLYETSTGTRVAKLQHSDAAGSDKFGLAVAMSDTLALVGAPFKDEATGAAYLFHYSGADADDDGLLDDWELNGIPYTDTLGVEQRYMLPDADPDRKNLYIELDAMTGFSFSPVAKSNLVVAFGLAPVDNPDGSTGITLNIQTDDTDLPFYDPWVTTDGWPGGGAGQLDYQQMRDARYGTTAERSDPSSTALLEAKAKAYRYCIFAANADIQVGGIADRPGDEFVLFAAGYSDDGQAAVFMHELGHNLGLGHGGGDDINGKPNYPSIMNYVLAYKRSWNEDFWRLDYSRLGSAFDVLDESSLDENAGIGTSGDLYDDFWMPFGVNEIDPTGQTVRALKYAPLNGSPVDFGDLAGTGFLDDTIASGVAQDLNYAVNPPVGISLPSLPSADPPLEPYDDWANIKLKLSAAIGPGAPAPKLPTDELTKDAIDWMEQNFPDPPSDIDGDGVADSDDNCLEAANPDQQDSNIDGIGNACDADLNNDCSVNFGDLAFLKAAFLPNPYDPDADFDGDGFVNFGDLAFLKSTFFNGISPGPGPGAPGNACE